MAATQILDALSVGMVPLALFGLWRPLRPRPRVRQFPKESVLPQREGLRILHLAFDDLHRPNSGGGAIRNHEINKRLAVRHEVTAVTATYPGCRERTEDGVHYIQAGRWLGYFG